MKVRIIALSLTLCFSLLSQSANAQDNKTPANNKVNFTQIRDLDPNQKPLNRPVRQKWAVVIGISKFFDRRLNSEQTYSRYARKFTDYLVDPHGGRFRADHVRMLTDDEASQQNITNSFGDSWLGKLAGPDDLVVVYIATRAFPTTDGGSYLCSYNCSMDNIFGSCLSIQSLMQTIRQNVKAERIVVVLESSYSGAAEIASNSKAAAAAGFNLDIEKVAFGKGFIVLTSSRPDQLSHGDLFSSNLAKTLRENDGKALLQDAFDKARQLTEVDSVSSVYKGRKQTPMMKSDWKGNELVLGCVPVEADSAIPDSAMVFLGAEAHYLKANRAILNSDFAQAEAEYKLALADDPSLTDARADYAVALTLQSKWKEAEEELRKAITIRPEDPLYLANYARILDKLGSKEESKKILEKAYTLNPKDRVVLVALSDKCNATGDHKTAMRLIDQALVLYPKDAVVQDRMCFLLSMEGRNAEAMRCAKEALTINPDLTSARLKLGALYVLTGDTQSAIKEYQSVVAKNDGNADAHYLLAQALEKANDRQNAVLEYNKFIQVAPLNDPRLATVKDQIQKMNSAN